MARQKKITTRDLRRQGYRISQKIPWGNPIVYILSILLVLICIVPVLYIILGGFRTNSQITRDPAGMPHPWNPGNYVAVLSGSVFWSELVNSLIVAAATTFLVVLLALMVSFAIARFRFKGRGFLYGLFAAGMMFPVTVAITPLFIEMRNIGLQNSLTGIVVCEVAFGLPQAVIILVPFLETIPRSIQEAAEIDGCSPLGFFWRMIVPLSWPGVATVGILQFIASWNNYMLPLYLLNDSTRYTLPLGVQMFSSQHSVDTAQVLAFTSLSMLPALIFFTIFQRRIVGGLTGAVKG